MFVTRQGDNYMAKLYLFLATYALYHKENSGKFESQLFRFRNSARQLEVPLMIGIPLLYRRAESVSVQGIYI